MPLRGQDAAFIGLTGGVSPPPLEPLLAFVAGDHKSFDANTMWWTAIALSIVGRTLEAIGLLMQKGSHNSERQVMEKERKAYFLRSWWLWGFLVFVVGHLLCWFALAMGTQTVLSCLMCWSTVTTIVLAPCCLKETVTVFRLLSVVILIGGCVWVVMSGPREYAVFSVESFSENLDNKYFIAITGLTVIALLSLTVEAILSTKTPRLSALKYTLISAMIGWYSVLSAKCASGLVFTSWHHQENQMVSWETWVIIVFMFVFAVLNVHFLNMGLADVDEGDAVYVIPIYEAAAIAGQIMVGGIFFQEFDQLTNVQQVSFWGGVFCVVFGIVLVSIKGPDNPNMQRPVLSPKSTGETPRRPADSVPELSLKDLDRQD